jgi:hypothetical protein
LAAYRPVRGVVFVQCDPAREPAITDLTHDNLSAAELAARVKLALAHL